MRILQIIGSLAPRYGGPSVACPAMCRELLRRGHEVCIYTTDVDGRSRLAVPLDGVVVHGGVPTRFFPGWTFPPKFKYSPAMGEALDHEMPGFDVAHLYSMFMYPSSAAAHFCRKYQVPYLLHPHGTLDPFQRRYHAGRKWLYTQIVERRNFSGATGVLFNSEEERRLAADTPGIGLAGKNGAKRRLQAVVPVGVDAEWFEDVSPAAREKYRRQFPELAGRRLVTYFGRMHFKKGLDILVAAFARVAAQRPDIHLVLAGPDNDGYARQVRGWLEKAGVLDRATFTGFLASEQSRVALQESALLALPSYAENFGQAVAEAMACGTPVVISDRVNIWPEVKGAGAGLVVACDVNQTADALASLLDSPAESRAMGSRGRRHAAANFSWAMVGRQMEQVYDEMMWIASRQKTS